MIMKVSGLNHLAMGVTGVVREKICYNYIYVVENWMTFHVVKSRYHMDNDAHQVTRIVRGSDYSLATALSEDKDIFRSITLFEN